MSVSITTNNHFRDLMYYYELSEKEQKEAKEMYGSNESEYFRYNESEYFRYKGYLYSLSDFMVIDDDHPDTEFRKWHGYLNDSMYSGVVVKYADIKCYNEDLDGKIIVGWFCS